MIYFLIILLCFLSFSLYFLFKFAIAIIEVEEVIAEALDIVEEKHENISKILEIPLFYDSREVRSVLEDIEETRNALIRISNQLEKKEVYIEKEQTKDEKT